MERPEKSQDTQDQELQPQDSPEPDSNKELPADPEPQELKDTPAEPMAQET
jgi:hypothetical protein